MGNSPVKLLRQCEALGLGTPREKLEVLKELLEIANGCRACAEAQLKSVQEGQAARNLKPWCEFQNIVGEPIFDTILQIVKNYPPSGVRELAGDIMAQLWHPSAIGRLLEDFEQRRDPLAERPPLRIFRSLGGIGTEAAARALMWMWGTKWDADVACALEMCDSLEAQDFLLRQAREHSSVYVRSMCMAHLKAPLTPAKEDLFIDRLKFGTHDEKFIAILKIQELGVIGAMDALVLARGGNGDRDLIGFINEALATLRQVCVVAESASVQ